LRSELLKRAPLNCQAFKTKRKDRDWLLVIGDWCNPRPGAATSPVAADTSGEFVTRQPFQCASLLLPTAWGQSVPEPRIRSRLAAWANSREGAWKICERLPYKCPRVF